MNKNGPQNLRANKEEQLPPTPRLMEGIMYHRVVTGIKRKITILNRKDYQNSDGNDKARCSKDVRKKDVRRTLFDESTTVPNLE